MPDPDRNEEKEERARLVLFGDWIVLIVLSVAIGMIAALMILWAFW